MVNVISELEKLGVELTDELKESIDFVSVELHT